jgi:hypothetical protein
MSADREPAGRPQRITSLLLAPSVGGLWLLVSLVFARRQEIWVDEATQLSGLTLGPVEVVHWLAGADSARFGVPGDRMPPLSYWLGWLWAQLFGLHENTLRFFGIALVLGASLLIVATARRAWGNAAALVSGVAFVSSPNVIGSGVEIRAYPLFLFGSSVVFWFFGQLLGSTSKTSSEQLLGRASTTSSEPSLARPWPRPLLGMTLACIACCFVHFFGLVLSGAVLLVSFLMCPRQRRAIAVCGVAIGVAALGLAPFVKAAMAISGGGQDSAGFARPVVRLVFRLLGGHPAASVYVPVSLALLLGAAILLALALTRSDPGARLARGLAAAVAAGFAVVVLAKLATGSFDSLAPSYNSWMVPAISLLFGAGASASLPGLLAKSRLLGAACLLLGNAAACLVFLTNSTAFVHTASERIDEIVLAEKKERLVAVVHDASGPWGHSYFPLRYALGPSLAQFVTRRRQNGELVLSRLSRPNPGAEISLSALPPGRALLLSTRHQDASAVQAYVRSDRLPALTSRDLKREFARQGWLPKRSETLIAQAASEVTWLDKKP